MRRHISWTALALALACGSGAAPEPAKSPAAEPAAAKTDTASDSSAPGDTSGSDSSKSSDAKSSDSDSTASSSPSTTLAGSDLTTVLQAVLDDPDLDQYLHLEKHGRLPLKLTGPGVPKDIKLVKGSYPVAIQADAGSGKAAVLVLTRIDLDGNIATVVYRYDAEGVHGTSKVKNGKSGWELMSSRIVQH